MQSRPSSDTIFVRGLYDFDGSGTEQLSFQRGEVLEVIYRDSSVRTHTVRTMPSADKAG